MNLIRSFAEQIFFGLLIESLSLAIAYATKNKPKVAITILIIGTVVAGLVAFAPYLLPLPQWYDDFSNPAFDEKYNPTLWRYEGTNRVVVKQENGTLVLTSISVAESGSVNLVPIDPNSWTFEQFQLMEAKLRLDSRRRGQGSFINIQAVTVVDGHSWWVECQLFNAEVDHTLYSCNIHNGERDSNGNLAYEYQTPTIVGEYGTWYVSRFELDYATGEFRFFLNDNLAANAKGAHGIGILYHAIIRGQAGIAQMLLDYGADINAGAGGSPALHGAVMFDRADMAEWLLAHGAEVNSLNYEKKTPLAVAVALKHEVMAEVLRAHGATE